MDRDDFMNIVKGKIEKEPIYDVEKEFITKNYKDADNGIYFLYNDDGIVIYVGMTGKDKTSSFYMRMYGNGNSAHCCNKPWSTEIKKFRFKSFPNLNKKELKVIERLMIYKNNQPIYNDIMIVNDYKIIECKL